MAEPITEISEELGLGTETTADKLAEARAKDADLQRETDLANKKGVVLAD